MKYMRMNEQLLQGLCSDGVWKYVVLWSLQVNRNHMILTWGDVYVDKVIRDTERDLYGNLIEGKNQIVLSTFCNNGQYQSNPLCPIEAALLSMSSHSYSLGEELIGKVALMGQHCWISSNEISSAFTYKYHEDWQLQVAAGIKTILLLPVVPHGVLQLGSLDLVSESSTSVSVIKDLFYKLYDAAISGNSSGTGFGYSHTWRQPTAMLPMNSSDVIPHDLFYSIKGSARLLNNDHLGLPHASPMLEFPLAEDSIVSIYGTSLAALSVEPLDCNDSDIWTNVHEELSQFTRFNTVPEPDKASISYMDKLINSDSKMSSRSVSHVENPGYGNIDHFILTEMEHEKQEHINNNTSVNDDAVTSNSSFHSELHKPLEPIPSDEREDYMWHIRRLRQQEPTSSALPEENGNKAGLHKQQENNDYAELLLDAIIGQVIWASNSVSSHSTDSPISCATQIQKEDHVVRMDESSLPKLPGGQDFSLISINEGFMSCAMTDSTPRETNKTILVEEFISDPIGGIHRETSIEIKGRCRKAGLHRTRPRDRQLIQDRMKELRQLVPNTSKCSIDSLLDKTIAHIQFLQSVSEKGDKLEKIVVINSESEESTKWQTGNCPLKVEVLDKPGHLLLEMLCAEYGVFLEIAHVLKGLDVSILKGLLESRSDKLWARFVIQASQGFDQMQILYPLMHLLQKQSWS
ncbi:transcription factor EMB1444-like isoform X1 [Oryza brachyantha]|uniref:transcription factor EMB1444-like isoform X1 n=1 Tax=Oryza brachyantha TaxID=4533 RepID=UPI0003EA85F5|nr:transcription factor EMB1444-like isoform X1 [Oryza brachyantha]